MNDSLGDRMKLFESITEITLVPNIPVIARIDGRCFHSLTKNFNRPYDEDMSRMMINVLFNLMIETKAVIGYTQSDEISLVFHTEKPTSQIWFNGRHSKMVSNLASQAGVFFYRECLLYKPEILDMVPTFDCRVWQVPNKEEVASYLLWREHDAVKNSITQAARCYYSDQELFKKSGSDKQEMLFAKGVNFNDYPAYFKRGTYVQKRKVARCFSPDEISRLPEGHAAKTNPDLQIFRNEYDVVDMPIFGKVTNKEGVIFNAELPKTNCQD